MTNQKKPSRASTPQVQRSTGGPAPDITDIRSPRPPRRHKFQPENSNLLATTFGKSLREASLSEARVGPDGPYLRPSDPIGAPYTSLRETPGKTTSWGAPQHHVRFRGTTDLSALLGRRRAADIDSYDPAADDQNKSPLDALRRKLRKEVSEENRLPPPSRAYPLRGHRNTAATSVVDGKPVSTFGGAARNDTFKAVQDRLQPGPGQYHTYQERKKQPKGLLVGGLKERGQIIMTKRGLVTETPIPRPTESFRRPKSRAQTAMSGISQGDAMDLTGTWNSDMAGLGITNGSLRDLTSAGDAAAPAEVEATMNRTMDTQVSRRSQSALGGTHVSKQQYGERPTSQMAMVFNDSHTFNAQLKRQEQRSRRISRIPNPGQ